MVEDEAGRRKFKPEPVVRKPMDDDTGRIDGPAYCSQEECQECGWQYQVVPLAGSGKGWINDDQYHHRHCSNLGQSHPHSTIIAS